MRSEVEKFDSLSSSWWDEGAEFKLLHQINPVRLRHALSQLGGVRGKRIADVGCGGGLFSGLLAREGAEVVGFDASEGAIDRAREHAKEEGLEIDYRVAAAEDLDTDDAGKFDAVVCFEMLEHAAEPASVVGRLAGLARGDGSKVLFSTINRTLRAYLLMVVGLERVLGVIPRGTHDPEMFVRPDELAGWCRDAGLKVTDVTGLRYSQFGKFYALDPCDVSVNYFLTASRHDDS